jgi:hypothetical protein
MPIREIGGQYTYLIPGEDLARFLIGMLSPELPVSYVVS